MTLPVPFGRLLLHFTEYFGVFQHFLDVGIMTENKEIRIHILTQNGIPNFDESCILS